MTTFLRQSANPTRRMAAALTAAALPSLLRAESLAEELALDPDGVNVSADWWKYILIALAALLVVFLAIRLTLYILRLAGVVLCLAVGALGAYFAQALLNPTLDRVMPSGAQPFTPAVSAIIGFLVSYLVATAIMAIIRRPATPAKK